MKTLIMKTLIMWSLIIGLTIFFCIGLESVILGLIYGVKTKKLKCFISKLLVKKTCSEEKPKTDSTKD